MLTSSPVSPFSNSPHFSSSAGKSPWPAVSAAMGDPGFGQFPITLNPTAQEFRPADSYTQNGDLPLLFYSYPYSFQPPPSTAPFMVPNSHPTLPPPLQVPTRALLLSSVPTNVSESTVRRELEVFGDVRAVQMERLRDGVVTVHFYDLRQAAEALTEIQEQHMQQQCRLREHFAGLMLSSPVNPPLPPPAHGLISGRAIWAQYTFPVAAGVPDGYNQGTVVVSNLDSDVSTGTLKEIFEAFGCVKEIKETPLKKNQKFVEFYDTRNAAKAVAAVNGREINGKPVVVEFSRLGCAAGGGGGVKYNYKQTKFHPVGSGGVPPSYIFSRKSLPAAVDSYCPRPPPSPPCNRKDRVVDYGGIGGGPKKNGKSFFKEHRQSPEQEGRWVGSGGGGCNGGRSKILKGSRYAREKCDPRFLIKNDGIISSFQDSRTTVMIKNIPNKYSQKLLLNILDNHCNEQTEVAGGDQPPSSYDFVYLPIDFVNKCNVGYGFVNMTSPVAARRLYTAFHQQNWEVFNSKKICEVSYARLQGLEALKDHFKNSKFPREAEEYMPVVFTPPRDGRTLTEPMPIVGRSSSLTVTSPPPTSSSSSEVGHDLTDGRTFFDDNLLVEDVKCDGGDGMTTTATTGGD